ncbi:MAG: sigma-54-dependent transcriptional regulator [Planctomycetota bacterium]
MGTDPFVLIVDDEPDTCSGLAALLAPKGYQTLTASSLEDARGVVAAQHLDAVLLDEHLPDGSGIDWVPDLRQACPSLAIIVITGGGDVPTAVKAMRQGADDFLTKPIHAGELMVVLERSLELERLKWMEHSQRRLHRKETVFMGESPSVKKMWSLAKRACEHESPVLLEGETGVGKGVVARWIHEGSPRHAKPFVGVNCSSMGGDLLASELFGHRKGAFTSATESREGLLEFANGGTLFLDEIGDMDLAVQAQILKVIEEKQFRRVGDTKSGSSNFRLICASNRNLEQDAREGRFRRDLFFRIHIFPITLPPLRNCRSDIPPLACRLLSAMGYGKQSVSDAGMESLKVYDWPGNIRELRNVLERACLIADGKPLAPQHFPGLSSPAGVPSSSEDKLWPLDDSEARHIQDALAHFGGDVPQTAQALHISRATLYRKLRKHGLLQPEE